MGDRITLSGGYFPHAAWLRERTHHAATVVRFVPGQNPPPALVAKLDEPMTVEGHTGEIVLLELRYVGAEWHDGAIAHMELCDFMPENIPWDQRPRGYWLESHTSVLKGDL